MAGDVGEFKILRKLSTATSILALTSAGVRISA